MSSLFLYLLLFSYFHLFSSEHTWDFVPSSSLIPLYLQNQIEDPYVDMLFSHSRTLADTTIDPRIILINPSFPLSQCIIGNDTQSNFQGFHINIIKSINNEFGWQQGVDYLFICVNETEMYRRVLANENVTYAGGNIIISASTIKAGYKLSQPLYDGGLSMLIRRNDPRTVWSFLLPISMKVGLSLILSSLVVSVFVWFFEEKKWRRAFKEHLVNFGEVMYDVFSSFFETNAIELKRFSSKILQWAFWLVVVIFLSIYQADLTQKLSSSYVQKEFRSFQEAISTQKTIATAEVLKPLVLSSIAGSNNIIYYPDKQSLEETTKNMISDLRNGKIDAIILTDALTDYYDTQYCDIQELDEVIEEFNYGLLFPPQADKKLMGSVSHAIIKLTETHTITLLRNQDLKMIRNVECEGEESISVSDLGGLWIILCIAIVLSVIVHFLKKFKVIVPLENYLTPYYTYQSQKTEIFESQLKEAVQFEVNKILRAYQDQLVEEIEDFENTLLLQNKKSEVDRE